MIDDRRHQEILELLVPYALGELDGEARVLLEAALDTDPTLRVELAEIEAVGAALLSGVVEHAAPPALKSRVLDAVGAASKPHAAPRAGDTTAPGVNTPSAPTSLGAHRARRRSRFLMPSFAGALAAACVALALVAINLNGDLDSTRDQLRKVQAAPTARDASAPAGFEDAQPFAVATMNSFADARGSLIKLKGDKYLLALNGIPSPGVGKSWQVWTRDSSGLIRNVAAWTTADESQLLVIDKADVVEVMISYEASSRPVPTPSDDVVADVQLKA